MAAIFKYSGLCETCDHDATCTLKRSPQLEIIHCEQFSTQPVMKKQTPAQEEMPPSDASRSHGIVTGSAKRVSLTDPIQVSQHGLNISDLRYRKLS